VIASDIFLLCSFPNLSLVLTNISLDLIVSLAMLLVGVPIARFRIPWWFGIVLLVHYAIFLTISLLLSFKIIPVSFSLWDRSQSQ
jgi:hypothetical protein